MDGKQYRTNDEVISAVEDFAAPMEELCGRRGDMSKDKPHRYSQPMNSSQPSPSYSKD